MTRSLYAMSRRTRRAKGSLPGAASRECQIRAFARRPHHQGHFASGRGPERVEHLGGGPTHRRTRGKAGGHAPTFSPDGQHEAHSALRPDAVPPPSALRIHVRYRSLPPSRSGLLASLMAQAKAKSIPINTSTWRVSAIA